MTLLKILVGALALANAGYFLWSHGIAGAANASGATPVATLKLASEAGLALPRSPDGTPAARDPQLAAADGGPPIHGKRCVTVGPFRDVAEAAHAASTLRSGGYDPRQRVVVGELWAGVWVFLPLAGSAAGNEQLLTKLKTAGIEDALEMPGPVEGSVISVGVFGEQRRADARIAQLQGLGLKPGTADRKRTGNVYWVDLDLKPADGSFDPADLQSPTGRISRLEVKACAAAGAPS